MSRLSGVLHSVDGCVVDLEIVCTSKSSHRSPSWPSLNSLLAHASVVVDPMPSLNPLPLAVTLVQTPPLPPPPSLPPPLLPPLPPHLPSPRPGETYWSEKVCYWIAANYILYPPWLLDQLATKFSLREEGKRSLINYS